MSPDRNSTNDHAQLQPAYCLVYRGVSADADYAVLVPLLCKLLRISSDETHVALKQAPIKLAHSRQHDRLRQHQLGLARLGCISSIESAWQYRNWTLPTSLKESFDLESEQRRTFALLQITPALGHVRLVQLASRLDTLHFHTLNHSDVLLESSAVAGSGTARWLTRIQTDLQSLAARRSPPIDLKINSAISIWPDDGTSLAEVLDHLEHKISQAGVISPPIITTNVGLLPARLFAGASVAQLHRGYLSEPPQLDKCNAVQALEITRHWPVYHAMPDASGGLSNQADPIEVLQKYRGGEPLRMERCRKLLRHFDQLDKLPSLPSVAIKAYQLVQRDDGDAGELARIVEQDPSLSARVLAMVNSSYYGLRNKVDSISHALVIVGRDELAHLAMHLSCETVFRSLGNKTAQQLWKHSAFTAEIAKDLASEHTQSNPATVYTAALLHDVGKIFLHSFANQEMQNIAAQAASQNLPSYELERSQFGHDHATLGAAILRRWGLPENLCRYVEQHHGPLPREEAIAGESALIALADHIAHMIHGDEPWADALRLRRCHLSALLPHFGTLTPESIDLLVEDMRGRKRITKHQSAA